VAKPGAKPKNMKLYNKIKDEIYKEQPKHSLYRSARIIKEYKKESGEFDEQSKPKMNIKKWFKQRWVSLPDYLNGNLVECGNSKLPLYPLCRPLEIAKRLKPEEIKDMIAKKQLLKEKPLKTSSIIKSDRLNIKPTITGLGAKKPEKKGVKLGVAKKPDFPSGITKDIFLEVARGVAKMKGFDPNLLQLAPDNSPYKLVYNGIKFGRKGYFDFIQYLYLVNKDEIQLEEAEMNRNNYLKRASNIKGNWRNKISPNLLAMSILW
jgi:hypothetical protein